jgi:hypothetical protein
MEAGLEANSPHSRAAATPPAGWVIWPGPGRGYIALETDLPSLADALEALWFLRVAAARQASPCFPTAETAGHERQPAPNPRTQLA